MGDDQVSFCAALSDHPIATHAVGEAVGRVLEDQGTDPDFAMVFVGPSLIGALTDIVSTVETLVRPGLTIAVGASGVLGGGREVQQGSAVSLFTGHLGCSPRVLRLTASRGQGRLVIGGLPDRDLAGHTMLLFADPFSFPVEAALAGIGRRWPGLTVAGGVAATSSNPGSNRFVHGMDSWTDGALAVLLPPQVSSSVVVSQGCRPIGAPWTVTAAEGDRVLELGGRPALERLEEVVEGLEPSDRALAATGLHVGRVIEAGPDGSAPPEALAGGSLVRAVLGGDKSSGTVVVGDRPPVGSTLQFQVRDAASASAEMGHLLDSEVAAFGEAAGSLLMTCTGRGSHLFEEPDHDAFKVAEVTRNSAVAGMFCGGEIGPVGGSPFLHSMTASVLMLR